VGCSPRGSFYPKKHPGGAPLFHLRVSAKKAFIASLGTADLKKTLDYKATDGKPFSQPLWQMLQHVVNHATHHRSEIATMVTMTKGSPAGTDMAIYYRQPKP